MLSRPAPCQRQRLTLSHARRTRSRAHSFQIRVVVVHTLAHLVRWGLRHSAGSSSLSGMLLHSTGFSGMFSVTLLVLAVLPMWRSKFFTRTLKFSFERRHWLHLLCVPMLAALCWHHQRVGVFCGVIGGIWSLDRAYLFFFRTRRVEDVNFTRLSDGFVQMRWRNPPGHRALAGQYVRIMVPAINREFHPFSTFEYFPELDSQELAMAADVGHASSSQSGTPASGAQALGAHAQVVCDANGSPGARRASTFKATIKMTAAMAHMAGVSDRASTMPHTVPALASLSALLLHIRCVCYR